MNINLRQLRAFVAGAQASSFSEAAERIGITQPGFSLLIRQIETELGVKLFDRTTRRVELTVEGEAFAEKVERILFELDSACRDVDDMRSLRRGRVRIAILPSAASTILPAIVSRLAQVHPDLDISIIERLAEPLRECVENGEVDFGIGMNPGVTPALRFISLLKDRLVCLSHEQDPLAVNPQPTWKDLCAQPYIGFAPTTSIDHQVRQLIGALRTAPLQRRSEINGLNTAVGLVRARLGITLIPELGLGGLDLTGLHMLALEGEAARREIGLVMLRRKTRSAAALAALNVFERFASSVGAEMIAKFADLPTLALPRLHAGA